MSESEAVPAPEEGQNEVDGAPSTGVIVEGCGEISLEQLEEQLRVMEEEQGKLAAEVEHTNETQRLEPHLAVIEEQFRRSFDDRFSTPAARPGARLPQDQPDIMRVNNVFREVSRDLGDDWRKVFSDLMFSFPPEVLTEELAKIDRMQPIIRGYRSLNVWKELTGAEFNIRDLIQALQKNNMNELADAALTILESADPNAAKTTKPVQRRKSDVASRSKLGLLDNRRMLLLAKKIGAEWEPLAQALGLPEEEIAEVKEGADSATYQGAFKILWSWRQTQPDIEEESSVELLKTALVTAGHQALAEQLGTI